MLRRLEEIFARARTRAFAPVDVASLVFFRIGFGLLMVIGAAVPGGVRTLLALLGAAALAFGLVVLIEATPNRLNHWLGVTHRNGWLYAVTGAVVVPAAIFSPVFAGTDHCHVVRRTTTTA